MEKPMPECSRRGLATLDSIPNTGYEYYRQFYEKYTPGHEHNAYFQFTRYTVPGKAT